MRATTNSFFSSDHFTNPNTFIKTLILSFLSLSLFFTVKHFSSDQLSLPFSSAANTTAADIHVALFSPPPPIVITSPPETTAREITPAAREIIPAARVDTPATREVPKDVVERTGIVDENGAMTNDFVIGDYDASLLEKAVNESLVERGSESDEDKWVKVERFRVCDESKREYIPCLDNVDVVSKLNLSEKGEKYERYCPKKGKELDCLVPNPKGYKDHIPWPKSRDEVVHGQTLLVAPNLEDLKMKMVEASWKCRPNLER